MTSRQQRERTGDAAVKKRKQKGKEDAEQASSQAVGQRKAERHKSEKKVVVSRRAASQYCLLWNEGRFRP